MKRILGILILFIVVYVATAIMASEVGADFLSGYAQKNLLRRIAPIGILGIGVAFVIITGGIDLSLGSMVCLIGVGVAWLLTQIGWPIWLVLLIALLVSAGIGWFHGALITKVNL
ncbi:MAG: ABC transporter permease, partial [Verrucomicrobiae bacterium]|nr:ABC transporter permease [Verrucomicrobiae bacterium]